MKCKCMLTKKLLSFAISLSMVVALGNAGSIAASAASEKIVCGLWIGPISNPVAPETADTPWTGSYIYYGAYNGNPVKYRVLQNNTNEFGGSTLFLDCDSTLFNAPFGTRNVWAGSKLQSDLNSSAFLYKSGGFSGMEINAIAISYADQHELTDSSAKDIYKNYVGLDKERVFLLDAEDITNPKYGYYNSNSFSNNHIKDGTSKKWWMRSSLYDPFNMTGAQEGMVTNYGVLSYNPPENENGVSPAFNVDLSKIMFTSLVSGAAGQPGAEYTLTLKYDGFLISVTDGESITRSGNTVTVPYTKGGSYATGMNQISVLIMDEEYAPETAVTSGFYFTSLKTEDLELSGKGTFSLPARYSKKVCGKDYHCYIIPQYIDGIKETDYAGEPVEIIIPEGGVEEPIQNEDNPAVNTENNSNGISDAVNQNTGDSEEAEIRDNKQKTTSITKLQATKKGFTVTWKKQAAKGIKGYQIQYSTDKKFAKDNTKEVLIKKVKTTSKKIKKLQSKKKYYVRIRTYRTSGDKTIYSKWSKIKSVKTK